MTSNAGIGASSRHSSMPLLVVRIAVLAAVSALFLYLFYHEANGDFYSDIPGHIRFAMSEDQSSYSLMYPLFVFSYNAGGALGVGIMLTVFEVATIVVSEYFLRALCPDTRHEAIFVLALALNFAIAIHLPFLHPKYMIGLSAGNSWHNGTFLGMKLMSLCAIWAYLRFVGFLKSNHPKADYLLFVLFVVLSATMKPSFVVAFGPAMVIICVMDLIQDRSTLKRSLLISVPFFIVLAVLAYQYMVLYVEDTSSGIEFGIARVWRHTHFFFPIAMLQSWAFPILVYVFCRKYQEADRNVRLTMIMFFISLAIFLFVNESGLRKYHGNFGWSMKFAVYYLFMTSIAVYCNTRGKRLKLLSVNAVDAAQEGSGDGIAGRLKDKGPDAAILLVLAWHVASGIGNIVNILNGNGYG